LAQLRWHLALWETLSARVSRAAFRFLAENRPQAAVSSLEHKVGSENRGTAISGTLIAALARRALQLCEKIHNLFAAPAHGA